MDDSTVAIRALYRGQEGLDPEVVTNSLEYLDDSCELINDPRKVQREFWTTAVS